VPAPTVERFHAGGGDSIEALLHLHRYQLAAHFAAGRNVLDVGCGDGYGARLMAQTARAVLGVDQDAAAVAEAVDKYPAANLRFSVCGVAGLASLDEGAYDLITCFELIEHVHEPEQERLAAEIARLLAPGGLAILSTPNGEVKARQYARFPEWRNPFHVRELTRGEFEAVLRRHFAHLTLVPQALDCASVVGLPRAHRLEVPAESAWVNLACASHAPIDWPDLPSAFLPAGMELIEQILADDRGRAERLVAAEQERDRLSEEHAQLCEQVESLLGDRERLLEDLDHATEAALATRGRLAHLELQLDELRAAFDLIEQSLSRRLSRLFERHLPRTRKLLISVGNRLTNGAGC
jgi:SAM-dependent methyltransferase